MEQHVFSSVKKKINVAFAKKAVNPLEAAVCLAGYAGEVRDNGEVQYEFIPEKITSPDVRELYEIVRNWLSFDESMPFLWYLEKAIVNNTPYVRYDLLLAMCYECEFRRKACSENYPILAEQLDLRLDGLTEHDINSEQTVAGEKAKSTSQDEWIIVAVKYANEIAIERWNAGIQEITARNICDAVANKLGKDKKYWGKKGLRSGHNVRKIALKGWSFTPPLEEINAAGVAPMAP